MAIEILRPNAAGDETSIATQYPASTEHWDKVDEAIADDLTTYVQVGSTTYARDIYNLPAHTTEAGDINSIKIYLRIKSTSGAVTVYAKPSQKSGETVSDGTEVSDNSGNWVDKSQTFTTNPATGVAYTWDEIDALQIGLQLKRTGMGAGLCTQVYVEVDYSEAVTATPSTIGLMMTERVSSLYFNQNTSGFGLGIGEQVSYQDRGFISPTMALKTTPQSSTLDRTDNVPVLDLAVTESQATLNKSQSTSTLGLGTERRVPSTNRGFVTQLLIQGLTLLIPDVTGGTTATPVTLALVLTQIDGNLNRVFNTPTLDLKLTRTEAYLQKEFGVPLLVLGTGRGAPVIDKGFLPPTIALRTTLRDYNLSKGQSVPVINLGIGRQASYHSREQITATLYLGISPNTSSLNRNNITQLLIQGLGLYIPDKSIGYVYIPEDIALTLGLQIPDVTYTLNLTRIPPTINLKTSLDTAKLEYTTFVQSTALLVLEMFSPTLFSGVFPLSVTGRYGVDSSVSWEGVLTATGRYGVAPSVSNEGILTASGRYG